ncbi:hypothetical protein M0811_07703 [Anaeramoeba ignava]|uniref:Uncharacterized protein n=1 Tax=Anaeramoeba ignava TaxID=1746090 RepID=A0A9Q0RDR5_ANAIG|nr:hypothetical protein M0811_07703 [Anaeramoeba ignava]
MSEFQQDLLNENDTEKELNTFNKEYQNFPQSQFVNESIPLYPFQNMNSGKDISKTETYHCLIFICVLICAGIIGYIIFAIILIASLAGGD